MLMAYSKEQSLREMLVNVCCNTGDVYPRDGFEPSRERIIELATSKNKLETPLITYIEDEEKNIEENDKVEDEKQTPKKTTKKTKNE